MAKPALYPGQEWGKYKIVRQLGRGGMGVVYLAEDTMLGREVALKILDRAVAASEIFEARMRQEARVVAFLEHPHIVPIHALERIEDELIIEMAFVPGGSLLDAMVSGRLSMPQLMRFSIDILDALACCHDAEIVHRDVKPSNILINQEEHALLSDFGLARVLSIRPALTVMECTSSCFFLGTPRYAPPEAWQKGDPTPAWDMFSLGSVLFEAISGRTPYEAESPLELARKMATEPPVPLAEAAPMPLSPELLELIDGMVKPNLADRVPHGRAGAELIQRVPECAAEDFPPIHARSRQRIFAKDNSEGKTRVSRSTLRHRRTIVIATTLGVVLIALAVTGVFLLVRGNAESTGSPEGGVDIAVGSLLEPEAQQYWPDQCLLRIDPKRSSWDALVAGEQLVWLLHARRVESGRFTIDGDWAEYDEDAGNRFEYGPLHGTCASVGENSFAFTLRFLTVLTGEETVRSFLMNTTSQGHKADQVIEWMESSTAVPALLYGELQPRAQSWVDEVEDQFLASSSQRIAVSRISEDPSLELEESSFGMGAATLAARTAKQPSTLAVAFTENRLVLWLRTLGTRAPREVEISISSAAAVRPAQMVRWHLRCRDQDISFTRERGDALIHMPFNGDFKEQRVQTSEWRAALQLPFSDLGLKEAPGPGQRWRLNCRLMNETGEALALWGAPAQDGTSALEHGMILKFLQD